MGMYTTEALTPEQFDEIVSTIAGGFCYGHEFRPNAQIAMALFVQGNTGRRIGDVLALRMGDFHKTSAGYELSITEQKTGKACNMPVSQYLYKAIREYAISAGRKANEALFDIKPRVVQKVLAACCEYLDTADKPYTNISTHSFRKYAATKVYEACGNDIHYASKYLNHSNIAVTEKYLRIDPKVYTDALTGTTDVIPFSIGGRK